MTRIWPLPCEGLGNSSYLAKVAEGLALAVDPGRDPRPYLGLAAAHGLRVAFTADTHVHADFVSGGRELAGLGARLLAPASSGLSFPHEELHDGQDLDLGGLTLRALATPGHTPEHLSYLLLDGAQPVAVFTGGALIVGGVARTDLADPARTQEWTRAAYRSARALLGLPGDLAAYPTHGPGSFCSAGEAGEHVTTIGREKAASPLLADASEDLFTTQVLARLGSHPAYFTRMPAVNRRGAPRHGISRPVLPALTVAHVAELAAEGATIVDARPAGAFAAAHIPGSMSNVLRPAFATWLGWLTSPDRPLIAVLDAGLPSASIPLLCPQTHRMPNGCRVLDVRQEGEWASGHLAGAIHAELGALAGPGAAARRGSGPVAVMCGHGERAMTGASLIAATGAARTAGVSVLEGGPSDWAKVTGEPLVHE